MCMNLISIIKILCIYRLFICVIQKSKIDDDVAFSGFFIKEMKKRTKSPQKDHQTCSWEFYPFTVHESKDTCSVMENPRI